MNTHSDEAHSVFAFIGRSRSHYHKYHIYANVCIRILAYSHMAKAPPTTATTTAKVRDFSVKSYVEIVCSVNSIINDNRSGYSSLSKLKIENINKILFVCATQAHSSPFLHQMNTQSTRQSIPASPFSDSHTHAQRK